jgi:hypothetical protein
MITLTNEQQDTLTKINAYATKEGWNIFEASPCGLSVQFQLQRIDDMELFNDDQGAIKYVINKAMYGSQIHRSAVLFMVENGDVDELKVMLKSLTIN